MQRLLSFFLASALCVCLVQPPRAQAAEVVSVGLIGSLVGVVMASMGYTWSANGMDASGFGDAIAGKIQDFLDIELGGMSIADWAALGTCAVVSGDGRIQIGQALIQKIVDFAEWLRGEKQLEDNSSAVVSGSDILCTLVDGKYYLNGFRVFINQAVGQPSFSSASIYNDYSGHLVPFPSFPDFYFESVSESGFDVHYAKRSVRTNASYVNLVYDESASVVRIFIEYTDYRDKVDSSLADALTASFLNGVGRLVLSTGVVSYPDVISSDQAYEVAIDGVSAADLEGIVDAAVAQALEGSLAVEGSVVDAVPAEPVVPEEGILDRILSAILAIPASIVDGVKTALQAVFVPSEASVDNFSGVVDEHLPFIEDLKGFGNDFKTALEHPEEYASTLTTIVDLGKKNDGIYGDAKVNLLDGSWYLPYKETGDDIVVGVAWLVFLWNLYGALPSIIHGGASGLYSFAGIEDERKRRSGD